MSYGITLEISGDYALFSRPEMKVERVSYDVITPSAARGVLEAIYWKPQIRWVIDRIRVLRPIQFTNIRRNEIGTKIPVKGGQGVNAAMKASTGDFHLNVEDHRQQRAALLLKDVCYWIEAHFDILDRRFDRNGPEMPQSAVAGKHLDMFQRRARKGQYFHHPYLGCREFPASFRLIEGDAPPEIPDSLQGEKDLGYMLHDILFEQNQKTKEVKNTHPRFFRAKMIDGLIEVPALNTENNQELWS
ncbi:MAG: type I-C CRISPR-associated protein Cas5 [Verrucomicrobia bacterium]|nr:type I-C CRISPR-associated protein Cas5 [Verrucomicrobiota bacterium]MCH8528949.1 type I-C CRISPR-associated protein Cas5c [Kiritimatiellia bacterium]